jgi:Flp pilus assembly protein TadD
LNNLAILYLKTHRVDDAIGTFQQCIEVAPAFGQAYLNLSRIYVIQGSTAKARAVLNDLLKIQPNDAAAKQALAQLQ